MKNISSLVKIQLKGVFDLSKLFRSSDSKIVNKYVLPTFAVALLILFGCLSGCYTSLIIDALEPIGAAHITLGLWMTVTSILTLFTTIFKVKGTLFQFSDYDMLMSMPIHTTNIVASRIIVLYLYDLIFALVILLPANIVYGVRMNVGVTFYLISTLLALFIPMIPILLGSLIGLVIAMASNRFRYSNIVTLAIFIGGFVAYMLFMIKFASVDGTDLMVQKISESMLSQINKIYPLVSLYIKAVVDYHILDFCVFMMISLLLFVAFCFIIGHNFKKINTAITSSKSKRKYQVKELKSNGILKALYQKEIRRYFASPMYVMNTCVGIIMITIATIVFLISGKEKVALVLSIPQFADQISIYVPVLLLFGACMSCTTAASISLEGKTFWLMKSFPVPEKYIFLSKIFVNLTITIPFILVDTIIYAIVLEMSWQRILLSILLPSIGALFISFLGLIINLKLPRFDWKSELEVVKQSIPTFITLFGGMFIGVLPVIIFFLIPEACFDLILLVFFVLFSIITLGLYRYLISKSIMDFRKL